jgi:DNA-binding transcriptional LysR family regulator
MAELQDQEAARWDDVRVFLAAYRDGSLGVAAGHLGLDVSTVSRRLAAFEAAIGARLFDRTRQGLLRLDAADILLPAAEAMEAAHARMTRDASALDAEAEGVVRLSIPPGLVDLFVVPSLPKLRARHPRITLEIDASVRVVDLTRHAADIALRSIRPSGADLFLTKLTSAPWVAVAGKQLVEQVGVLESWQNVPWIAWDRDLASLPAARWLAKHVPDADVALRTSHFASHLTAAAAGVGAALIPTPYLQRAGLAPFHYAKPLERSAADWPEDDLWLVSHRALREVPRVAAVWAFLKDLPWATPEQP